MFHFTDLTLGGKNPARSAQSCLNIQGERLSSKANMVPEVGKVAGVSHVLMLRGNQ